MTTREFACLALGMALGVATGARLVRVARSRPWARRDIRVTFTPSGVRSRAATLAEESPAAESPVSAVAETPPSPVVTIVESPATDPDELSLPTVVESPLVSVAEAAVATVAESPVTAALPVAEAPPRPAIAALAGPVAEAPAEAAPVEAATPDPTSTPSILRPIGSQPFDSFPTWTQRDRVEPATGTGGDSIGISISREIDPQMTALRAATMPILASPTGLKPGVGAMTLVGNTLLTATMAEADQRHPRADASTTPGNGFSASFAARAVSDGDGFPGNGVAGFGASEGGFAARVAAGNGGYSASRFAAGGTSAGEAPGGGGAPLEVAAAPVDSGACADLRRVAEERCAVATLAREGARRAAEGLRTVQRTYDDHVGGAESQAASADPRSVRTAKETAQGAFRKARAAATTRAAVETAARDWLTEINRINLATREASSQAEQHRAAATELAPTLERLALEADAARISAESAEEACVAAREAVAACEETATADVVASQPAPARPEPVEAGIPAAATAARQPIGFEDDEAMGSRAGEDAAIIRLLGGDREILPRIVARLAGDDPEEQRRWRDLLTGLVEALVARSIEAASFDFPANHPFWGLFNPAQCRDIASALASLGYRHDGFGDWADEHVPTQRDLSMAVGYAGFDPMRVRQWPAESEMHELMRDVTVAAGEYIREAASTLTLGELVSLLGRRADPLTDLWNDWGPVRTLLLAAG